MARKFTAGEWEYPADHCGYDTVVAWNEDGTHPYGITVSTEDRTEEQVKADAELIAAAPELFSALDFLMSTWIAAIDHDNSADAVVECSRLSGFRFERKAIAALARVDPETAEHHAACLESTEPKPKRPRRDEAALKLLQEVICNNERVARNGTSAWREVIIANVIKPLRKIEAVLAGREG